MTEEVRRTEFLVPEPALALGALLGVDVPDLEREGLPLLWHWLFLLDRPAQADLGADGHPGRNTVPAPPEPGRRRMWAGGTVSAQGALRCGQRATKSTKVVSVHDKLGRSGRLTFAVVSHEIEQNGRIVVSEEQNIVYRDAVTGEAPIAEAAPLVPAETGDWSIDVSPTLLFRFSALTYNAHRIHYDHDYARDVEGYPGLVTHGPLQAIAMAEAARAQGRAGAQRFDYRLVSPLFDHQGLVVSAVSEQQITRTIAKDIHRRQTAVGTLRSLR